MRNLRLCLVFLCIVVWTGVMLDLPGVLGSLTRLIQWPALIVWLGYVLFRGNLRKPHPFHWAMLFFILWNVVTAFWSDDVSGTFHYFSRYLMALIVSMMMWDTYRTQDAAGTATRAFIVGCYVIVVLTVLSYLYSATPTANSFQSRYSAGDLHPDDLGLIMAIGIPLAWRGVLSRTASHTWVRVLNILFPFAAMLSIILSGTRGGLVAAAPSVLYMALCIRLISVRWRAILVVFMVVCLIGGLHLLSEHRMSSQLDRLTTTSSSLSASGDGLGGRIGIWRAGSIVFARHPFIGIGAGAFPEATRSFMDGVSPTGDPLVAHNTYLSVLVETGLVGFAAFLYVIGQLVKSIVRYRGQDKGAWIAALATWLVGSFSLTFEYRPQTWLLFTIILIGTQHFERVSQHDTEGVSQRDAEGISRARNKRIYSRPGTSPMR